MFTAVLAAAQTGLHTGKTGVHEEDQGAGQQHPKGVHGHAQIARGAGQFGYGIFGGRRGFRRGLPVKLKEPRARVNKT